MTNSTLTLGSGRITTTDAGGTHTLASNLALQSSGQWNIGSSHLRITGSVMNTSNHTITRVGEGTLTLEGNSQLGQLHLLNGHTEIKGASVMFPHAATSEALRVGSGFRTNAPTLDVTDGAVVDLSQTSQELRISGDTGTRVTFSGEGTSGVVQSDLIVGDSSSEGLLVIENGANVSSFRSRIGNRQDAFGRLEIRSGGTMTTEIGPWVGAFSNARGEILVTGAGSRLEAGATLVLGSLDSPDSGGDVWVEDGGAIELGSDLLFRTDNHTVTVDGGTLTAGGVYTTGTPGSTLRLSDPAGGPALTVGGSNTDRTFAGTIEDADGGPGSIRKVGTGTWTLTGTNTYSGGTEVTGGGAIAIESDASLGASSGTLSLDNASLVLLGNVSGTRELQIGGGGGTVEASGGTGHFSGPLSGSGELSLIGPHPITLAGNNAGFTGTINVSDGTLRTEGGNVFAPGIPVHLSAGANLQVMDDETGASLSGNGTVLLHASLALADNSGPPAFSGFFSGAGDLNVDAGSGRFALAGAAAHTGATHIQSGELHLQGGSISNASGIHLSTGTALTGSGTATASFSGDAGSNIDAQGFLVLGHASAANGFAHQGDLSVGSHTVQVLSAGAAVLSGETTLSGGLLRAENGMDLGATGSVTGHGILSGSVSGDTGSSIEATGNMTLGNPDDSNGFAFSGDLSISNGTLVLLNDGQAELTGDTVLDNGELNAGQGLRLSSDASLTALTPSTIRGDMTNDGTVHVSSGSTLVFNDNVDGSGNYTGTGNVQFNQTFSPGNSPGDISFEGDMTLQDTATLLMELGGHEPGAEFDFLQIGGTANLGGLLQIALLDNFSPSIGDEFLVATWSNFTGQFSNSQPLQVEEHEFEVQLSDEGMTLVAIPEPATWALVAITFLCVGGLSCLKRKK
ncbi:MAG: autotransporter-associated beta strand repeat-containing protein [Verrucomicrobia bacterium]|nr:autotransporter-associated beta strand repeat-containing protein [Verrucomicrobiota bacterium]MCH8510184.1 autotransporter-associated beta strand repeat-containing protein [Kiritimatiellia bacterium]